MNYRLYKENLGFENYLDAIIFSRLRTCNHHLTIGSWRWCNTPRNERICARCAKREIGTEFHYILNCLSLQHERNQYFPASYTKLKNTTSFEHVVPNSERWFFKQDYVHL